MDNLLKASHENQKTELAELDEEVLVQITGGHPGDHRTCECPDGTVHIDAP